MLSILGQIYGRIADLRNAFYDRGIFESFDLGARTISVGNITTGGTGKTPLVAYVAEILAERGEKVCVLTRGYGRKEPQKRVLVSDSNSVLAAPSQAGDEPYELARKLDGKAIIIADADRVSAAEWAKRKFGVTVFVLDDGFQHRKAKRDVDIVCIDATDPFGGGKMLPSGRLREPLSGLVRANVIVITRANLVSAEAISNLRSEISNWNRHAAVFEAENRIAAVRSIGEFHAKPQTTQRGDSKLKAFAFCGLGNPENFYEQLRRENLSVVGTKSFRDHHEYSHADIAVIEKLAREASAGIILTTAKDAVKLSNLKFEIPCFVVEIDVEIDKPDMFAELL